ncbi:MAG: hypothetical protein LBQ79_03325 [Deltaproteobacteria bacterium]|jgi:hypothetical protein|nr:hypothetical protein [Deltaproteobacteria bacterium]
MIQNDNESESPPSGSSPETEGLPVCLKGIAHKGEVDGFLYRSVMRQSYRNDTGISLETSYSFPVSGEAGLTGFSATVDGKALAGRIMAREAAEELYEEAIADGDTPVMLSESSPGILTLSIGNLEPGDEAETDLQMTELLGFEGAAARITIPTVLAPRSGDMHREGELRIHESVFCSPGAGYPLSVAIRVPWLGRGASVCCPSHVTSTEAGEEGLLVRTAGGSLPDRDFVLLLELADAPGRASAYSFLNPREGTWGTLSLFRPEIPEGAGDTRLNVLFDASSTMEGAAWSQAGEIVMEALTRLRDRRGDISVMVFNSMGLAELMADGSWRDGQYGSGHGHDIPEPGKGGPPGGGLPGGGGRQEHPPADYPQPFFEYRRRLRAELSRIGPSGEKGLAGALRAFTGAMGDGPDGPPALVLLTDCLESGLRAMTDAARELSPRLFAVGLGHSPLAGHLRSLARSAGRGGISISSAPAEDARACARRLARLTGTRAVISAATRWSGAAPIWSSPAPLTLAPDFTCPVWAVYRDEPDESPGLAWSYPGGGGDGMDAGAPEPVGDTGLPVLLARERVLALENALGDGGGPGTRDKTEAGGRSGPARGGPKRKIPGFPNGSRRGAAGSGQSPDPAGDARELALRHGILTPRTAWCLVYRRYPDQKAGSMPPLQQIPQTPPETRAHVEWRPEPPRHMAAPVHARMSFAVDALDMSMEPVPMAREPERVGDPLRRRYSLERPPGTGTGGSETGKD